MGAEAVKKLLQDIDIDKELEFLKEELRTAQGQRRNRAIKRLEVIEAFRNSGNNPEWMIMDVRRSFRRSFARWFNLMVDALRPLT